MKHIQNIGKWRIGEAVLANVPDEPRYHMKLGKIKRIVQAEDGSFLRLIIFFPHLIEECDTIPFEPSELILINFKELDFEL